MPDGVALLEELGVQRAALRGKPFRGIRFLDGAAEAEGAFPEGSGLGVRRLELHDALIRAAEAEGASLRWDCPLRALRPGAAETDAGTILARWVVGADGLHTQVARLARLERPLARPSQRYGVRRHTRIAPWSDVIEVHFADGVEAYVTPVADDEVGIALLFSRQTSRGASFEDLLEHFPALRASLRGARWASEARGAGPLEREATCAAPDDGIALVGDAAGYVDAITGEGMSVAFHEARALAECLESGSLAAYPARVRRIRRLPDATTRLMLWLKDRPRLRRRVIGSRARDPRLFDRLLAVHGRQMTPRQVGVGSIARLSLRVAGAWR